MSRLRRYLGNDDCMNRGNIAIPLLFVFVGLLCANCGDSESAAGSEDGGDPDGGNDVDTGSGDADTDSDTDSDTDADTDTDSDSDTDSDTDSDSDSDTDTDTDADTDTDSDTDMDAGSGDGGQDGGEECIPEIVDCNIFCGKVPDTCTDDLHDCGGCDFDLVCDVVTNLCVPPLVTCEDLDADCGTIRNSCGVRLDCGYCPDDEECNPDTNKCINCTEPTCQDLGFECGMAWNGCGKPSNQVNKIDCTDCLTGTVCSPISNLCEPDCVPDDPEVICTLAELERGVDCGYISDECGGIVDCGSDCPDGEACGVRGVANRCDEPERPLECVVLGWECGELDSACSGTQDCGDCPDGEVCNSNHICGPPCESVTCGNAYAGQCGQQLDDGCGGNINCPCGAGLVCNATAPGVTGTCETLNTCNDYTTRLDGQPCSNGASPAFPRGDGADLTCPCQTGMICIDGGGNIVTGAETGTCCTNTSPCDGVHCTATNSCTSEVEYCCDLGTQWCDNNDNTCVDRLMCDEITYNAPIPPPGGFANGEAGAPCSDNDNPLFDDGSGDLMVCPCDPGLVCVDGDQTTPGYCCLNENDCDDTHLYDTDCRVPNSCGVEFQDQNCCPQSRCCIDSVCSDGNTCEDFTDGGVGEACSNQRHFPLCAPDAGATNNPRDLRCNCDPGLCCEQPDPDAGACIVTPVCDDTCEVYNGCTENDMDCCEADEYCDIGNDVCEVAETCDTIWHSSEHPDGDLGDYCSDSTNTNLPAGDGSDLACPCDTPPGWSNITCEGDSTTVMGVCECETNTCYCNNHGQSDGCGGTQDCPCPPTTPDCDTTTNPPSCCAPYECPTGAGEECGIPHYSCGDMVSCGCPDPYETCGGGDPPVANECGCTNASCVGKAGWVDNGCGGQMWCPV